VRAAAPPPPPAALTPAQLDAALDDVLARPEFTWRQPRPVLAVEVLDGGLLAWLRDAAERLRTGFRRAAEAFGDWLEKLFRRPPRPAGGGFNLGEWLVAPEVLLPALALLLAAVAAKLLWDRRHLRPAVVATAEAVAAAPDLADEAVAADRLPEDGWLRLAADLLARGEPRLALRALHLAALAHLAARGLVQVARGKSNRDYLRELRRRAPAAPAAAEAFAAQLADFERIWYGAHPADAALYGRSLELLTRLRAC
jgi:hypothetical protein